MYNVGRTSNNKNALTVLSNLSALMVKLFDSDNAVFEINISEKKEFNKNA